MANSRSNIYPIQLQGAELNLNKFDAEIKPYSGFNKNNSPFVGGCLSNLFTKTEENTTGSSDSVYVDDNGDVFEAKLDGLYKNDNKVLDFPNVVDDNFIDLEQLDLPDNTVYVRTRSYRSNPVDFNIFYITRESNYLFTLHYNNAVLDIYIPLIINNVYVPITDLQFDVTEQLTVLIRISGIYDNKVYMESMAAHWTGSAFQSYDDFNPQIYVNIEDYINIPPVVIGYDYASIYGLDETYVFSNGNKITSMSETGSNNKTTCIGKSKYFYYIESAEDISYGKAYLLDVTEYTTSGSKSIVICCDVEVSSSGIIFKKDSDSCVTSSSFSSGVTLSVKLGKVNNAYDIGGLCYALTFSDYKNFFGIGGDGVFTDQVTLVEDDNGNKQAMMYIGVRNGNKLYNNGLLTGLAIGNVLVTEWNSVIQNTVTTRYQHNVITYKSTSGKWFCIKCNITRDEWLHEIKPKMSKINNQLVINKTKVNSYRLTDGKSLYFAPDWNNRISHVTLSGFHSNTAITENAGYMATSINEYALKNNASILLNPVPVIHISGNHAEFEGNLSLVDAQIINFYSGTNGEILYKYSFMENREEVLFNKDLLNLPYPVNSDGNVQLSASLFCKTEQFGNDIFIKEGSSAYQLMKEGAESVMSYYLGTLIENLGDIFVLQGQYYAIINQQIFNVQFSGGIVQSLSFVVSVENLQFVGNSVYQAYFFSKTNRCLYTFSGANMLSQAQLVDKISEIYSYKYNQSTQSIILVTDIGTIVSSNLGMYLLEDIIPDNVFFYNKGAVFVSDTTLYFIQYYPEDGFTKHRILLETSFYGLNNQTVTINDCLYFRLFSEEHEEGEIKVSATTLSLKGRKTEDTTFKIKASDWDSLTDSLYVRYQPKEQRGLGISFSIDSPFKIASMSVGTQADAILIDKVSKGAINAPQQTSNNVEW